MNTLIKNRKYWINYALLLPVLLLVILGFAAQYGAFYADPVVESIAPLLKKQFFWTLLGVVVMFVLMLIPPRYLWKLTPLFYGGSLFLSSLLIKFHHPVMTAVTGTKRWLKLGPVTLQPSEFMKLGYILMLAYLITRHQRQVTVDTTWKNDAMLLGQMVLVSLPVFGLMFFQRDFGSGLVFVSILLGMLLVSGCSWKFLALIFGSLGVLAGTTILLVLTDWGEQFLMYLHFKPYQFNRIHAWLAPMDYADSISFQQAHGLMAIGSGGMTGKGLTNLEVYVPVRESDMIFTVIGEAYGFAGACLLLLLFFYLIYQILICTLHAKKEFYAYISTGVIMYLLFHIIENIGSNIGLLPLTGIPLPFISQGGSAYLANFAAIGLVLSMYPADKEVDLKS